jgi:hypothetical protein
MHTQGKGIIPKFSTSNASSFSVAEGGTVLLLEADGSPALLEITNFVMLHGFGNVIAQ